MLENRQLGNYRLLRRIGSGGMGEVYMAEDIRIARQVAIKVIRAEIDPYPDAAAIQDSQKLFLREMRAITKLDHPYILQLFDFGEERLDGSMLTYMVMPLRSEGSLSEWLQKRGGRLSLAEAAHFLVQAAEALQHAHDHALVHQDVKPANFLVRDRVGSALPDILLSDFGIAKALSGTSTASQTVRGTPAYMAPEQWEGAPVPASDQYALGMMAYMLLAGQPPFSGRMEQVMRQHLMVQPPPPSASNPTIPPDLDKVILIALAKQPQARFGSIMAFARAFQQAIQPSITPTHQSQSSPSSIAPTVEAAPPRVSESQPDPVVPSSPLLPTVPATPTPIPETPPVAASGVPTQYADAAQLAGASAVDQTPPPLDPHVLSKIAPVSKPTTAPKPSRAIALVGVVILLLLSTVIGIGTYQAHVASVNATATADAQATIDAINAQATATTIAANPYPSYMSGSGTLALLDPLSEANYWSEQSDTSFGGNCAFQNNTFQVSQVQADKVYLCPNNTQFGDFTLEVQLVILTGDCGGIAIRDNDATSQFYYFRVCADGTYAIKKYVDSNGANTVSLASGSNSAIATGLNGDNTLGIVAKGSSMELYVNRQLVDSANDSDYSTGAISFCAENQTNSTQVAYSNVRVWD